MKIILSYFCSGTVLKYSTKNSSMRLTPKMMKLRFHKLTKSSAAIKFTFYIIFQTLPNVSQSRKTANHFKQNLHKICTIKKFVLPLH